MKSVEKALLDKIPTFRELNLVEAEDNGEKMVRLRNQFALSVENIDQRMMEYTGNDIFVRSGLADRLNKAASTINQFNENWMLLVYYGYRHPEIQRTNFKAQLEKIATRSDIDDKEQYAHTFIAHPEVAGHPTGGAVDVTIINRDDRTKIDMGTELREFGKKTLTFWPHITKEQWRHRQVLRQSMAGAGFAPYDGEWWHFSYGDKEWAYTYNKPKALYTEISFTPTG